MFGGIEGERCREDVDGHHLNRGEVAGECVRACCVKGRGERCGTSEKLEATLWMGLKLWWGWGRKTNLDIAADVSDIGESCPTECFGSVERHGELVVCHKPGEGGRPTGAVQKKCEIGCNLSSWESMSVWKDLRCDVQFGKIWIGRIVDGCNNGHGHMGDRRARGGSLGRGRVRDISVHGYL